MTRLIIALIALIAAVLAWRLYAKARKTRQAGRIARHRGRQAAAWQKALDHAAAVRAKDE